MQVTFKDPNRLELRKLLNIIFPENPEVLLTNICRCEDYKDLIIYSISYADRAGLWNFMTEKLNNLDDETLSRLNPIILKTYLNEVKRYSNERK